MPGLCGIVSSAGGHASYANSFRQVNAVAGIDFRETVYEMDQCLLMSFETLWSGGSSGSTRRSGHGGAVLLLEGEIYDPEEVSTGSASSGGQDACDALMARYLTMGPRFAEALNGEFNIVIFEPEHRRLSIFNDHVGSNPMYYWQTSRGFVFGSEKKFVLAAGNERREIDRVGLLQVFVHHHNLEDRTFIEGVKRLAPSTRLVFQDGRVRISDCAAVREGTGPMAGTRDLLQRWQHELRVATAKRLRGKNRLIISLSAGLDSRAVACSIDRATRPVWARTWGRPGSFEVKYSREIARRLGFQHLVEDPSDFLLSDAVRKIVWRTDGETQFRNGLSLFTHRLMKEHGDHVIGGWLGDVTSGAHLRPFMLLPMGRERFVDRIFSWYAAFGETELREVFNVGFLQRYLPAVREEFHKSYGRFAEAPNTWAHELWDLRNRQARMTISSMPVDSHLFGKVRPFFDRSYLEFVMSIPVRWRIGQNLYKSMIHMLGPEIRDVPNGNTNVLVRASPLANLRGYVGSVGSRVVDRVRRRVRPSSLAVRPQGPAMDLGAHVRRDHGLRRIVEAFVDSDGCDDSIFNRAGIRRVLDSHYDGHTDRSEMIGILATWVVALQYFVYRRTEHCPTEAEPYLH